MQDNYYLQTFLHGGFPISTCIFGIEKMKENWCDKIYPSNTICLRSMNPIFQSNFIECLLAYCITPYIFFM